MMRLHARDIAHRIKSGKGETLTEVLVSMVIGALAILMMTMAISTSSNMVADSRKTMDTYYAKDNAVSNSEATGAGINELEGKTVTLKEGEMAVLSGKVDYRIVKQFNDEEIVTYEKSQGS